MTLVSPGSSPGQCDCSLRDGQVLFRAWLGLVAALIPDPVLYVNGSNMAHMSWNTFMDERKSYDIYSYGGWSL